MILFIVVSIYLPAFFVHPQYNFIYETYSNGYYGQDYTVQNQTIIKNPSYNQNAPYPPPLQYSGSSLYMYNVSTNLNTQISFQQAQQYVVDSSMISPDGFKIENGTNGGGLFLFGSGEYDYGSEYLVGNHVSKKLSMRTNGDYYNGFHFLGWILK